MYLTFFKTRFASLWTRASCMPIRRIVVTQLLVRICDTPFELACVQPPLPSKKLERSVCDLFTVDNRVQRPRDFFRNVWKMIWLVISHTSLHHWNSEIWPAFIFAGFAIGAFCTESSTFVRDNNMRTAHRRRSELHRRSRTFRTRLEDLHIRLFL